MTAARAAAEVGGAGAIQMGGDRLPSSFVLQGLQLVVFEVLQQEAPIHVGFCRAVTAGSLRGREAMTGRVAAPTYRRFASTEAVLESSVVVRKEGRFTKSGFFIKYLARNTPAHIVTVALCGADMNAPLSSLPCVPPTTAT